MVCVNQASAQTAGGHAYAIGGPGKFGDDSIVFAGGGLEYVNVHGVGGAFEVGRVTGAKTNVPGAPPRSSFVWGGHLIVPLAPGNSAKRVQPFMFAGIAFPVDPIADSSYALMFGAG